MGTRHLIAAVIDGDFKLAQYGQWDGYPDGQGARVLDFVRTSDMDAFKAKLRTCTWITKEQTVVVIATPNWTKAFPHLSRDAGADVLTMILGSTEPLYLSDSRGFAGDSLFCEWAYVIDCDNDAIEVYRGFNSSPTPADSRFPSGAEWLEKSTDYQPVRLVKKFTFANLPTNEQFVQVLESEDDAEINWGGQMAGLVADLAKTA